MKQEYTRPFSREYQAATGRPVQHVAMVHPSALTDFYDAGYVSWLESELKTARAFVPTLKGAINGTRTSQT